jgi:hypothetical protein
MDLTPFKNCLAHKQSIYISNDVHPYKPCCWYKTGIAADNVDDYRAQLASHDIEKNCAHCINQESSGATWSHRQLFDKPNEFVLGVCFDNICNLKCVTCGPVHTSKLISEWSKLGKLPEANKSYYVKLMKQAPGKFEFIKTVLDNSEFDILRLEIFGGEPLINPTVFEFIDWVAEQPYAKNTFLSITSNTTTYTDKIESYCNKFKNVGLQLSIDGLGDTFEYLRFGAVYQEAVANINQYYELLDRCPNYSVAFNYTLSWMNCLHFGEFYKWAADNYPNIHLHLTKLEGPACYSVNIMSDSRRQQITDTVMSQIGTIELGPQFDKLKDLYQQSMRYSHNQTADRSGYKEAIRSLTQLDEIRLNNFKATFAPILELIQDEFK